MNTTENLAEALRLAKDYAEDEDWGRVKGCINLALAAHEAAARATAPETGDTNGRHDGLRPDLHGRVLLGGHTPGALADLLWASDDVMALNAELGLTMDQLVRLARAALAAAGHAPKPAVQGEAQDAARYRWLAAHCRSTPEHWGGRWSIVIEGPAPERQDCEDAFDAAIDAAMQAQGEAVSSNRKRAAIRKAEQDAARYRWLVTRPCDGDDTYYIATEDGSEANSDGWWALGGDLPKERADEYIDAAMQAQEGGNV